ncbi:MAG: prohibitin family protein [Candidatus Hinthialibacter antarcticus]|nr:prohibitin family protein [Candidatus Hinthialibacter antarcticus]
MEEATKPTPKKAGLIRRFGYWIASKRFGMEIFLLICVLLTLFFADRIFITIQSGELGVLYKRFGGTVVDKPPLQEGLHFVLPINIVSVYDVRVQQEEHEYHVLSKDGLRISISVSIRFHPHRDENLNLLHKQIGPEYLKKIIIPEIESALRTIIGKYEPAELYQADYSLLESAISESLMQLTESFVVLDDLLITEIALPPLVQDAIQNKLMEQHNAEKYKYLLQQAEEEAKRKVILATGIRDFQDIVGEGISTQLLQWRGIEATLELAKSPNSKIVIIGNSRDGLPLIFNASDAPTLEQNATNLGSLPSASAGAAMDATEVEKLTSAYSSVFQTPLSTFEKMGSSGLK